MVTRITSYNVCYTKLLRSLITKLKSLGVTVMAYGGYHTEVGLIVRQAQEAGMKLTVMSRITSYNVCYTKLLRAAAARHRCGGLRRGDERGVAGSGRRAVTVFLRVFALVALLLAGGLADARAAEVRAGIHDDFGRIVIEWPQPVRYAARIEGNRLIVEFDQALDVV